jgi:hypothetical protein
MNFKAAFGAYFLVMVPAFAGPAAEASSARAERIAQGAEALRPSLVETRRDLHMHPELSNREERMARVVLSAPR